MPNYLIELYAPPGVISPDPETAEFVVSTATPERAKELAEMVVNAEEDSPETFVRWTSSPGYRPGGLFFSISVVDITETKLEPTLKEEDVLRREVADYEEEEFSELLDEFRKQNKLHTNEGSTGVKNLGKICEAIGYSAEPFETVCGSNSYANLIEFLSDNSGAVEAILEWMNDNHSENWAENLRSHLTEE